MRPNWGAEFKNVDIPATIAANEDGCREVLGTAEGIKRTKPDGQAPTEKPFRAII